jgi:Mn2+/Fe2+ NRAMP family transporter
MENTEIKQESSRPVSFLLLIPALIFGVISIALAIVGLGLIPLLPAMVGILLGGLSLLFFRKSYRIFTRIVIGISVVAALISITRITFFKNKVAADDTFDTTLVRTQKGIDADLKDAFDEIDLGTGEPKDTTDTQ